MFRPSLKRPRDIHDSPFSSTPPTLAKPRHNNRNIFDSDASYDSMIYHLPSDSPSNPFRRFEGYTPPVLPQETPVDEHLILRFKLASESHDVHRVVSVPANFTFWHLSRLTQFLFGWKDHRSERSPYNPSEKVLRKTEHVFTVHRRIAMVMIGRNAGLIKDGKPVLHISGDAMKDRRAPNDAPWEREERYTLYHLWHRPGDPNDMSRAIIYEYDAFTKRREVVHISISVDSDKLKTLFEPDEMSNIPLVLSGRGLPNDDDDDDDFALDLQQWNEPHVFENFMMEQDEDEEPGEPVSPSVRLSEEQAIVKKRMSGPLPKHLPIDEDDVPDPEVDAPPAKEAPRAVVQRAQAPAKKRASTSHLPHPDESVEVGAPAKAVRAMRPLPRHAVAQHMKRAAVAAVRLPDPDESREVGACSDDEEEEEEEPMRPAARRRLKALFPDPEESVEVYRDNGEGQHGVVRRRSRMVIDTRGPAQATLPLAKRAASPVKQVAPRRISRRIVLGELEQLATESPDDEDEV